VRMTIELAFFRLNRSRPPGTKWDEGASWCTAYNERRAERPRRCGTSQLPDNDVFSWWGKRPAYTFAEMHQGKTPRRAIRVLGWHILHLRIPRLTVLGRDGAACRECSETHTSSTTKLPPYGKSFLLHHCRQVDACLFFF
jgi:hypothetical protein